MKVAEYIEILKRMPPGAEIVEAWDDGLLHPAQKPKEKPAYLMPGTESPTWMPVKDGAARIVQIS